MASVSVVEAQSALSKMPTYADLVDDIRGLQEYIETLGSVLSQLGALFCAAKSAGPNAAHIMDAGQYLAQDWANSADCTREQSMESFSLAEACIPRREWRTCGYPDKPSPEEIQGEKDFAALVTGFPSLAYEEDLGIEFVTIKGESA